MKVSIITAVLNGKPTLRDCIKSVADQEYSDIQHIVIDGGSTDGTIDVIRGHEKYLSRWISEPDGGLYDAMNKGIKLATGDIIGILNSDDIYAETNAIDSVVSCLEKSGVDTCYGDLVYVQRENMDKHVRYWKAGSFRRDKFRTGWMPPHPTFFVRRHVYEKYGVFNPDFPLAADYELMLRFLYKHRVSTAYIPKIMVRMRTGGSCRPGFPNTMNNILENYQAWRVNDLKPNPLTFLMKPLSKTLQYVG